MRIQQVKLLSMRLIVLYIALFTAGSLFGQNNLIRWEQNPTVTWADFQGEPKQNSENLAITRSGVKYSYGATISNGKLELDFEVYSYFDRDQSWTVDHESQYLLGHEQLHFDIAELSARKLRKAFATYPFTEDFQKEVQDIFKQNNEDRRVMQKTYDKESDHSRSKSDQVRWEQYVKKELQQLDAYRGTQVIWKE
jgi:hypothetical protein